MKQIGQHEHGPRNFCTDGLKRAVISLGVNPDTISKLEKQYAGKKLVAALASELQRDENEILERLSKKIFVEHIQLENTRELRSKYDQDLKKLFTKDYVLQHRLFPIMRKGENLIVAFADPLDLDAFNDISFRSSSPIKPVLMSEREIVAAINAVFSELAHEDLTYAEGLCGQTNEERRLELLEVDSSEDRTVNTAEAGREPIVQLVNKILSRAAAAGASDVHLEPLEDGLDVRFRVDGVMNSVLKTNKHVHPFVIARLKLLASMDIAERRRPQDGRFRIKLGDNQARDIRVSSVRTPFGEKLVLRLLNSGEDSVCLDNIGMQPDVREEWKQALRSTDRIIVVCGPTGSGKSTTLFASVNEMRTGDKSIVSVEDPIEYRIEGATQIEVNAKIGVTFASGLRSILRQDPDIILVGEIRDLETAEIAFRAAQTGHQVITTLHTNDAASSVIRLIDMGLDASTISASLGAVVAQRLVRTTCEHCKCDVEAEAAEKLAAKTGLAPELFKKGTGCSECAFTGYKGRIGVYSLLNITPEVRDLVRQSASESAIENAARSAGFKTLYEAALELVEQGITSFDEVERVIGVNAKPRAIEQKVVREESGYIDAPNLFSNVSKPTKVAPSYSPSQPLPGSVAKNLGIEVADIEEKQSVIDLAESLAPSEIRKTRVLLIDDDPRVRTIMSKLLQSREFEVVEANDGLHALQQLEGYRPDIIICDLEMPEMNGLEFVKQIRSHEALLSIPVIMLTSADSEENEIDLISAGADDFVSKTASVKLVATRINRLLAAH